MNDNESRVKKSAQNMGMGFLYQAVMLILSFVSRTTFIHTLGDEYLGINATFADVLSLLSMADLGFGTAMAYSFYKPLAENDHRQITALINFYRKVYTIIAVAVFVVGMACVPFLRYIVNTDENIPNLELYYILSLLGIVFSYMFIYKTTLLTADQRDYVVVNVRMWTSVLKTVLQIAVLYLAKDYVLYLIIGIATQFLNNLVASKKADAQYPYLNKTVGKPSDYAKLKKNIWENMKSVFIYKLSNTLFGASDSIVMSIVLGTAVVGHYSNYLMVNNKLLLIIQIVFSAMTASVGNVMAKENSKKRMEVFSALQSASFIFCGVITCSYCLLINDLIKVWLKDEVYLLSYTTVVAITSNAYFSCVLLPLWVFRDAAGLYKKTKYVMLVSSVENIILSFILGAKMGVAGVLFASSIARITTNLWYEPMVLYREYFHSSVIRYYISMIKNALLVALTIFVLKTALGGIVVESWLMLVVKMAIVGSCCALIFMLAYSQTTGFKIIKDRVYVIISKLRKSEETYGSIS
jgi:O-antigen/teichoic acid export membrane protein